MPSASDPTLRRLASAVLMPGFTGTTAPDWLRREVEAGLGGVCLFAPNVTGGDVAALTWDLHGIRSDVVVSSDEEGGEVTRLEVETGSSWPTHAALGRVDDLAATTAVAAGIGRQCRDRGIDLALSPDVDVTSNPDNPVIGLRSFGADPALVARHGAAFVSGLQGVGVAACAKHFPGHGDTRTDSHHGLPVIDVTRETLDARDLVPFDAVVGAGVRAVMTAHVVIPAIDDQPATLSPEVLGILRGDLGFSGVVVSDAVDMQAISAGIGRGPGAARALAAGVDLVCIGNPHHPTRYDDEAAFHEVRDAVVDAVLRGELRADRLEEAARHIAELAWWVGENRAAALRAEEEGAVHAGANGDGAAPTLDAARRSAADVARRALEVASVAPSRRRLHVLDLRDVPNMAAGPRPSGVIDALRQTRTDVTVHEVGGSAEPLHTISSAVAASEDEDLLVVAGSPHRSPTVQRRLDHVLAARPDTVVVATGLPDPRDRLGEHWVRTVGDTRSAGAAVVELLTP